MSVFWVTGRNILGRGGTHIFFNNFFNGKIYIIYAFGKAFCLPKSIKLYIFQKTGKKFQVSPVNLGRVGLP